MLDDHLGARPACGRGSLALPRGRTCGPQPDAGQPGVEPPHRAHPVLPGREGGDARHWTPLISK